MLNQGASESEVRRAAGGTTTIVVRKGLVLPELFPTQMHQRMGRILSRTAGSRRNRSSLCHTCCMQLGKLAKFTILEKYPPGMEIRRIADIVGRTCAEGSGAFLAKEAAVWRGITHRQAQTVAWSVHRVT